jgi:DNA-binding NtrC family response regulator
MKKTILIIDDKLKVCQTLAQTFEQLGYQPVYALNGKDALDLFTRQPTHVVLLDVMLGEENGMEVLKQLLSIRKQTPVIMITGYASIETAVQAIKLGAFDYVKKPLNFGQLVKVVENAIQISYLSEENQQLKKHLLELAPRVITQNPRMLAVCEKSKKLAATDLPVLIVGENGTGKEVLADFIHLNSSRGSRKMVKLNCAAFSETLLDNELFGHEKGAYTGADSVFKGVFEKADRSSVFLDEIGDMPLTIQSKILRTLQNREIRRLGSNETLTIDVRFIAATNKDIKKLMREQKFREDLWYRLNTAVIEIPPLRERQDDLPLFVDHFLAEYARANAATVKRVSAAVLQRFAQHDWPGNVREIKNTLNYAAAISANEQIEIEDLPPDFLETPHQNAPENILEDMEKNLILKTLQKTGYNKKKAAEFLNMSRRTFYRRLERYGLADQPN